MQIWALARYWIVIRFGCFPVNLLLIFRTAFLKNISGWLLLKHTLDSNNWRSSSNKYILEIPIFMYPNELCLHILIILIFTSTTNKLATISYCWIQYPIALPTPNDIYFWGIFFKLRTNSFTAFDRFLFCERLFTPKSKTATSKPHVYIKIKLMKATVALCSIILLVQN